MNKSEFKVPENYFREKKALLKEIPSKRKNIFQLYPWPSALSAAASIALLIGLALNYNEENFVEPENLDQISASAIDEFISYSPYAAYPETYLLEEDNLEMELSNTDELFEHELIDDYLNQYTNEFL